jgi:O-acetyl-ADP-ribose deacetylase (regulator of RNase III)
VKPGNLLKEENATFIVNASNTKLQLGSGVSSAFRKVCGVVMQMEMLDKYKSLEQELQKGDVIATSAGKATNFKYALHAAVMDYNTGVKGINKLPTIDTIKIILQNIEPYLQWYADNHNNTPMKLVLPLMGCGVGGLDTEEVLEIYKSFFSREAPYLCEVIVYGYSTKNYSLAKKVCI